MSSNARVTDYMDMAVLLSRETGLTMAQARKTAQTAAAWGMQPFAAYDMATAAIRAGMDAESFIASLQAVANVYDVAQLVGPRHDRLVTLALSWWAGVAGWWRRAYNTVGCLAAARFVAPVPRETVGRHRK